eukprot:4002827-Amphidinium_carterae.1
MSWELYCFAIWKPRNSECTAPGIGYGSSNHFLELTFRREGLVWHDYGGRPHLDAFPYETLEFSRPIQLK